MGPSEHRERAILVGQVTHLQSRWQVNEYLDELELLADTAGAQVLERVVQEKSRMDPAFLIGRGKVSELAQMAKYLDADLIIFDDDLSPAQVKNIEGVVGIKIIDRSGLILDIFAKHARTKEARTQVELAQLRYLLPRLTRQWSHLSRQVGGIGVRGPGETQLEIDRRLIRKRIAVLEKELSKIVQQRDNRRKRRKNVFKVALIGYTNVGKSTLLNAMTDSQVLVENQLFATLDPTVRAMDLSEHEKILLIDTVGFIRKLPHHLVASFKSTLEEASEADLLLHIIDIAHPAFDDQIKTVQGVLEELNIDKIPLLYVFNKIDSLQDSSLMSFLKEKWDPCVFVSAQKGIFIQELLHKVQSFYNSKFETLNLTLPIQRADLVSQLHNWGEVLSIEYQESQALVQMKAQAQRVDQIKRLTQELE
ncbi:GTPase HflX [candidate division KSB1 bacterium]|nr:GTPase HflX [candidate division KSB1 bacterium]